MKFPLGSTVQIAGYVAKNQRSGKRYPLVLMLEPPLACHIACIGCGEIRENEPNKAGLGAEECTEGRAPGVCEKQAPPGGRRGRGNRPRGRGGIVSGRRGGAARLQGDRGRPAPG